MVGTVPSPRGTERLGMGQEGWNQSVLFLNLSWHCSESGSGWGLGRPEGVQRAGRGLERLGERW